MFAIKTQDTEEALPHDPLHKAFFFSSRPIWVLVPLWGLMMALAVVSTPRPAHAEEAQAQQVPIEGAKVPNRHIESDAKPSRKAVKGERVMQPEYGADASSHEAAHTVQQKGVTPEPAGATDMYMKIGDIKGESKD